jgi:hypothetical protein
MELAADGRNFVTKAENLRRDFHQTVFQTAALSGLTVFDTAWIKLG